jgi:hypothetical protein
LLLTALAVTMAIGATVAEAASSPTVATGSATSISSAGATLHGTVKPNGSQTSYRFEWGLTAAYGLASAVKSAGGSSTATVPESTSIHGLIPGTTYHYRIEALNKYGGAIGADRKFTTAGHPPPAVATGPAQVTGSGSAVVSGVINPNGQSTTYFFQYGASTAYTGQSLPATIPASGSARTVIAQLSPLPAGTFIHYRLVAVHSGAPAQYGADSVFLTFPSPRPTPRIPARTSPGRDRHRPFVFTTTGRIAGPGWIPKPLSCFGSATVRFMLGHRQIAEGLATVDSNCMFALQTSFAHKPGRGNRHRQVHLKVLIHFQGNGYLAPANARTETVTAG